MINSSQLREVIIKPALSMLQLYSNDAEELMVFTCAVETNGGSFLKQVKGPALGIYQMEPITYNDIWQHFIRKRTDIVSILSLHFDVNRILDSNRLTYDLWYATAMTRIHYLRVKEQLPKANDLDAIWEYYKKYYNSSLGKAKKDSSIEKYERYIKQ